MPFLSLRFLALTLLLLLAVMRSSPTGRAGLLPVHQPQVRVHHRRRAAADGRERWRGIPDEEKVGVRLLGCICNFGAPAAVGLTCLCVSSRGYKHGCGHGFGHGCRRGLVWPCTTKQINASFSETGLSATTISQTSKAQLTREKTGQCNAMQCNSSHVI